MPDYTSRRFKKKCQPKIEYKFTRFVNYEKTVYLQSRRIRNEREREGERPLF